MCGKRQKVDDLQKQHRRSGNVIVDTLFQNERYHLNLNIIAFIPVNLFDISKGK